MLLVFLSWFLSILIRVFTSRAICLHAAGQNEVTAYRMHSRQQNRQYKLVYYRRPVVNNKYSVSTFKEIY